MRYYYYNHIFSDEEEESFWLDQLTDFLRHYKLSQYLETFVSEGFDRLLSVSFFFFLDILRNVFNITFQFTAI